MSYSRVISLVAMVFAIVAMVGGVHAISIGNININGYADCSTLLSDYSSVVTSCTSSFASTCISVNANINITTTGNFNVQNCELQMYEGSNGQNVITSWGNLTVTNSNITTNTSVFSSGIYSSDIVIKPNSNFSMINSFVSNMGWSETTGKRGLELNSTVLVFSNNTLNYNYNGITLYSDASGSTITNTTTNSNSNSGIYIQSGSGFSLNDINTDFNMNYGVYLSSSSNNTLENVNTSLNTYGFYLISSSNNNLTDISSNSNAFYGIYILFGLNNMITNFNSNLDFFALYLSSSQNNLISSAKIIDSYYGIYLFVSPENTISRSIVNVSLAKPVQILYSSKTTVQDSQVINETQIIGGVSIIGSNGFESYENVFLNTSFSGVTESVGAKSQSIRQWYLDGFVNNTAGTALPNVNVSVWNSSNDLQVWGLTNNTGWVQRMNIMQYVNNSGTTSYYGNFTILFNASGFINKTLSWAIGSGTSGTFVGDDGLTYGDWAQNNTRLSMTLADTTPPIITLLGSNPTVVEAGSTYTDAGATANDSIDGDLTVKIVTLSNVNTSAIGIYTITYDVTDSSGNAATQVVRTVNVTDATPPVITLLGSNSVTINVGSTYTDAGATAFDSFDGNLTANITINNTVNASVIGTYNITYDVSDSSGNNATTVTRTVNVVAVAAPSPPAPAGGGGGGGGGGFATCTENWTCGDWSVCTINGIQTRTCTDSKSCGTTKNEPATNQSCTYVAPIVPVGQTSENATTVTNGTSANTSAAGSSSGITGFITAGETATYVGIVVVVIIILGVVYFKLIRKKK